MTETPPPGTIVEVRFKALVVAVLTPEGRYPAVRVRRFLNESDDTPVRFEQTYYLDDLQPHTPTPEPPA